MSKIYRSAMGKSIDMDSIRLNNESSIAVGNMKVNARGDELGPGGEIVKSRNQVMADYYKLNTPVAESVSIPQIDDSVFTAAAIEAEKPALRGSLAERVSKTVKK